MSRIFVAGYPKSGNTWLSRLLGEFYNAPVKRWRAALPLAVEGLDRESDIVIHQLHLKPVPADAPAQAEAIEHAYFWDWRVPLRPDDRIVFIMRDVRDVIVSAYFYWQRDELWEAVDAVTLGNRPLSVHGSWQNFNGLWMDAFAESTDFIPLKYEQLNADPVEVLRTVVGALAIHDPRIVFQPVHFAAAVEAQSFKNTVKRIEKDGDDRPYGKTIQLRNLRKGVVGDWRNHFTGPLAYTVEQRCGQMLRLTGYEKDPDWWKGL